MSRATNATWNPETEKYREQSVIKLLERNDDFVCWQILEQLLPFAEGVTKTTVVSLWGCSMPWQPAPRLTEAGTLRRNWIRETLYE